MRTIRITGTGSALPGRIVTNKELEQLVETSDEWIRERTGIAERHVSVGETVVTLASEAARKALEQAGKTAEEIDLILVASCSPEQYLPCCACQVQAAIGAVNALAFDVNAACSGFLFALNTADAYLRTGLAENALVIGSEVLSKLVDWTDRGSCILFGDGAGAVVVERCRTESRAVEYSNALPETEKGMQETAEEKRIPASGILGRALHSDGTGGGVLQCGARELTTPYARTSAAKRTKTSRRMAENLIFRWTDRKCTGSPPDGCHSASRKHCQMPDLLCRILTCSYCIRPTHVLLMQWRKDCMQTETNSPPIWKGSEICPLPPFRCFWMN